MAQHCPHRKGAARNPVGIIILLTLILIGLIMIALALSNRETPQPTEPSTQATEPSTAPSSAPPPTTTEPPVVKEASATLSAVGDMLMHSPVFNSGYDAATGSYNLDSIFTYFTDYIQSADYAVGNLETTLAGLDNGYSYSGYPQFNCPDAIIDSMKTAGFDMLLTANNHSYDTRGIGLRRTPQVIADRALSYLGTRATADAPTYAVVELNGIRLGLACYTYEDNASPDVKAPNFITMSAEDAPLINTFDYTNLDLFYAELSGSMAEMEEQGADAVILFIHWGNEYQITQNATQSEMAQALCDLGVDVIIGGHPHVVQPVQLLTSSTDDSQKTVCLYSMGNAVSNQRRENMNLNTGHTEDGVLFSVTFSRYSDGTVILESADLLPTWVNLRTNPDTGRREYNILPLDDQIEDWKAQFGLTDAALAGCEASYQRTTDITGAGMAEVSSYLAQHTTEVEARLGVE